MNRFTAWNIISFSILFDSPAINWRFVQSVTLPSTSDSWERLQQQAADSCDPECRKKQVEKMELMNSDQQFFSNLRGKSTDISDQMLEVNGHRHDTIFPKTSKLFLTLLFTY